MALLLPPVGRGEKRDIDRSLWPVQKRVHCFEANTKAKRKDCISPLAFNDQHSPVHNLTTETIGFCFPGEIYLIFRYNM